MLSLEATTPLSPFPQFSDEDMLKGVSCKKGVTFDLSDSEDTDSLMSLEESAPKGLSLVHFSEH